MDARDGSYARAKASPKAYCAAYVVAQKYGVDTSGFNFDKVCEMQAHGDNGARRSFVPLSGSIRNAAYGISNHIGASLGSRNRSLSRTRLPSQRAGQRRNPGKQKSSRNADKMVLPGISGA